MLPQVPEPVGAGSAIPLPAGDWVIVARYEEGAGPFSEPSGIGDLQRWGGEGPFIEMEGIGSLKERGFKGQDTCRSGTRVW